VTRSTRLVLAVLPLVFAVWLGCAQQATTPPSSGGNTPQTLSVSVSPSSVTLAAGSQIDLQAFVKNFKNDSSVTWSRVGDTSCGTLSVSGLHAYFASKQRSDSITITVRVRSNEDTSKHADARITIAGIRQNERLLITPMNVTLDTGKTQQFTATIYGLKDTAVFWTLTSGHGALSSEGLYTSPTSIAGQSEVAFVRATSRADTALHTEAEITIAPQPTPEPCFRTIIQPLFTSHCGKSGCHNPIDKYFGYDLTTYSGMMEKAVVPGDTAHSLLWYRANHVSKLSQDKLDNIARWILMGAHNTQCENNTIDTSNVHYSNFVNNFFEYNCRGCHSGRFAGQSGGLDFGTYDVIKSVVDDGRLLESIIPNGTLPHMPMYGNQLDEPTMAKIRCWINRGAPND
jgi:hypothetical protein